jgi:hypothetical protein
LATAGSSTTRRCWWLDFFRREELQRGQASNVMEIGFLYQLNQRVTLGTGIDEDSPDVRMGFSMQVTLGK